MEAQEADLISAAAWAELHVRQIKSLHAEGAFRVVLGE
jgi:hypothetical protein